MTKTKTKIEYGIVKKGIVLEIPVIVPITHRDDFLEKITGEEWLVHAKDHGYIQPQSVNIGIEVKEVDKGRALVFIYKYFENLSL